MYDTFQTQLKESFTYNKKETGNFEEVDFKTLIDVYWEYYNDIEWELIMEKNQKHMEEYYMSLLNELDKGD